MEKRYTVHPQEGYTLVENTGGPTLGMGCLKLKERDGLAFKNLSGQEELLPYEDWRLPSEARAKDLASRLSVEQMAGLMLWTPHQFVPFVTEGPFVGHYAGGDYTPDIDPTTLTDEQERFITRDGIRHMLLCEVASAEVAAAWNNRVQAAAERSPWGIPVCLASDPRHSAGRKSAEFAGTGKEVSRWPEGMGLAAAFDSELVGQFARIAREEYRALGISMALGPQIDMATEPRWMRLEDTYGTRAEMNIALARAYCDGMQTTPGSPTGWGTESVATMVKHWPGGGTGEGGRDAHYPYGKYAVFPADRLNEHMRPFLEGAFRLDGPTGKAAAVMPYYTVSWGQDKLTGENVGNAYSRGIIQGLLRERAGYDGIVCTDWGVVNTPKASVGDFGAWSHGVEELNETERYLKILQNDVDMFGGAGRVEPVVAAYALGCAQFGEEVMHRRMVRSAERILTNLFRLGLFENPYLDREHSETVVGKAEFVRAGREAQRCSVIELKNTGALPLKKGIRLYVPERRLAPHMSFFRTQVPETTVTMLTQADGWFELVNRPEDADAALCLIESPLCDCYDQAEAAQGRGNGYYPITLQYRPYTANAARAHSIASGDPREQDCDRSYRGKTTTAYNASDLDMILDTRAKMGKKPVIVAIQLHNPCVLREFEPWVDGILAHFGVENQVLLEILTGAAQPGGRLPFPMPSDMETVELHSEDVGDDICPYVDSLGNCYDYGYPEK